MTFRFSVVVLALSMVASSASAQRSGGGAASMSPQFHGIGPSVTSVSPSVSSQFGTGGSFSTPGIPPSLTSITNGPSMTVPFSHGFNSGRHGGHHNGRGGNFRGGRGRNFTPFFPLYSYPYYAYDDSGLYPDSNATPDSNYQQPDPQPPAMTIFENRPGYQPPPVAPYAPQSAPAADNTSRDVENPAEPPAKVADQTPTVLVFRDGHQLEVSNYAIQGETLYNLSADGPRKIKLADLDLDKTIKLNDERGNAFHLPKKKAQA